MTTKDFKVNHYYRVVYQTHHIDILVVDDRHFNVLYSRWGRGAMRNINYLCGTLVKPLSDYLIKQYKIMEILWL